MKNQDTETDTERAGCSPLGAAPGSATPVCDAAVKTGRHYMMTDITAEVVPVSVAQELERRLREAENLITSVVKNVPIIEDKWRQTYLYDKCKRFVEQNDKLSCEASAPKAKDNQ